MPFSSQHFQKSTCARHRGYGLNELRHIPPQHGAVGRGQATRSIHAASMVCSVHSHSDPAKPRGHTL